MTTNDTPDLPRWYHGPLGRTEAAQPKVIVPMLSPEERRDWRAWAKEEAKRQAQPKEEES